jgi:hypothetical protein
MGAEKSIGISFIAFVFNNTVLPWHWQERDVFSQQMAAGFSAVPSLISFLSKVVQCRSSDRTMSLCIFLFEVHPPSFAQSFFYDLQE